MRAAPLVPRAGIAPAVTLHRGRAVFTSSPTRLSMPVSTPSGQGYKPSRRVEGCENPDVMVSNQNGISLSSAAPGFPPACSSAAWSTFRRPLATSSRSFLAAEYIADEVGTIDARRPF
jgi:hypothetical protein